jgi:hypothetical protein
MAAPLRYILHQGPTLEGMFRLAWSSATVPIRKRWPLDHPKPRPEVDKHVEAPPREMVEAYLEAVGGEPDSYRGLLPPHLFAQWSYDQIARTLQHRLDPMHELLNGGCRLEINGPLPASNELRVAVRLEDVDASPSRLRFHHVVETGPLTHPSALVAHVYFVLPKSKGEGGDDRSSPNVREDAREITRWLIPDDAGWEFAKLTGDFNPIHWLRPAARATGFDNTILHGFATMARAMEGLNTEWFGGETPIELFDVRFTHPLVLPADVGLYVSGDSEPGDANPGPVEVAVGDEPGGTAYMIGECRWHG